MLKKIMISFFTTFILFGFCSTPVRASETLFPPEPPQAVDDAYPYFASFFSQSKNNPLSYSVRFFYSKTPILYTETPASSYGGKSFYFIAGTDHFQYKQQCTTSVGVQSCGISGPYYNTSASNSILVGHFVDAASMAKNSFGILNSNHDVFNPNGDLVFQKPQIPEPPVLPDTSWTESLGSAFLPILIAVIGGMILLTLFWLLLKRCSTFFRNFGMR